MADFFEELAALLPRLGPAGDLLAIAAAPVAVAVTGFVINNLKEARITALQGAMDRLKDERDAQLAREQETAARSAAQLQEQLQRLQASYDVLDARYQRVTQAGAVIQAQLQTIQDIAGDIADRIGVEECSILVPAPTKIAGDAAEHLVFLYASGPAAETLKSVHVPIATSDAGAVYRSGAAAITDAAGNSARAFSQQTDAVTGFTTKEKLSVCLRYRTRTVGVAQFVNKIGGAFAPADVQRAGDECLQLAGRVAEFTADPARLIALGHAPREKSVEATIMAIDLSGFSRLFETLDNNIITDLLNQYFREVCQVALAEGTSVDQFIGDGALFTFNVAEPRADHAAAGLSAARQMREAFRRLRAKWEQLGHASAGDLFLRVGLSFGEVVRAEVGYRSTRATVIGTPVNTASKACASAPRDRDVIVVTAPFRAALGGSVHLAAVEAAPLRGASQPEAAPLFELV